VSGRMIPPLVFSSAAEGLITTLSAKGFIFIRPPTLLYY
jgi:hypothetical protein